MKWKELPRKTNQNNLLIEHMIHIVFNTADVEVLKKAIELDDTMQGDVMEVKDDYAVGPIADLYSAEGREARNDWWKQVLSGGDYEGLLKKE
jgi:hypothetical protein